MALSETGKFTKSGGICASQIIECDDQSGLSDG